MAYSLDLGGCTFGFELGFGVFGCFLGDGLKHGTGSSIDQFLGLLQTQVGRTW